MIEIVLPVDARVKIDYCGPMTTTQDRNGDYRMIGNRIVCAIHGDDEDAKCLACRSTADVEKGAKVEW